jgi:hypothetical protein
VTRFSSRQAVAMKQGIVMTNSAEFLRPLWASLLPIPLPTHKVLERLGRKFSPEALEHGVIVTAEEAMLRTTPALDSRPTSLSKGSGYQVH